MVFDAVCARNIIDMNISGVAWIQKFTVEIQIVLLMKSIDVYSRCRMLWHKAVISMPKYKMDEMTPPSMACSRKSL